MKHREVLDVDKIVVYDNNDNPVCLALNILPSVITISRIKDPDFKKNLRELGINKTVVVDDYNDNTEIDNIQI